MLMNFTKINSVDISFAGNNIYWLTVLDLNIILRYSDNNASFSEKNKKHLFSVIDGINFLTNVVAQN